jgi:hypothetical protein
MFVAYWLIVCSRLGDLAPEQHQFMDFQDLVYMDSDLIFYEQRGMYPWTYCTYILHIYSIVVVLHACVNECAPMIGVD